MNTVEDSIDHLWYLIHHVFLPPQLPNTGDDEEGPEKDASLLRFLSQQLHSSASFLDGSTKTAIVAAHCMVNKLVSILDASGQIYQHHLELALMELCRDGGVLPIPVQAQNAALVIRGEGPVLFFEAFELSPPNQSTMSTKGRLARCFPGPAVTMDIETFQAAGFLASAAATIAKMSRQTAAEMVPRATKAGQEHFEERETTDPLLVTDLLLSVLEAAGRAVQVPRVWKNTRDEVLHTTGLTPWRRSPVWLMVRVAMQLCLRKATGSDDCYKLTMAFFLSKVLDIAQSKELPGHVLDCMISKISRRLLKMRHLQKYGNWYSIVNNALQRCISHIEHRWDSICQSSDPNMQISRLDELKPANDTVAALDGLDTYLEMLRALPEASSAKQFSPLPILLGYPAETLPRIHSHTTGSDIYYVLVAFETWVACNLDEWLSSHTANGDTCADLATVMRDYHEHASIQYNNNPESLSVMVLTTLQLWVGCDRVATQRHPMLLEYDPGVPTSLLQSLILPLKNDLERLSGVERYIRERQVTANNRHGSIFTDLHSRTSFAVRSFRASTEHQQLRTRIETSAQEEQNRKKTELVKKKLEYEELMAKYYASTCEHIWFYPRYGSKYQKHSNSCSRCSYHNKAQSIKIDVHEWPLPSDDLEASAVVFELHCPPIFGAWRDATLFVLLDMLKLSYSLCETVEHHYTIDYSLSSFRTRSGPDRLLLRSTTKPHTATHRRDVKVEIATVSDVCVNNGLRFRYYDNTTRCFTATLSHTEDLAKACMYKLQDAAPLQRFLYRPDSRPSGPDPNLVIADQHACPVHMRLDEFRALAALPLGTQLQWSNILVQLAAPSIDFKKIDTALVLLQASLQAGPPAPDGTVSRESHQEPSQAPFGRQLIRGLQGGLARIRENWESVYALGSFIALAARQLSLAGSSDVEELCLAYLSDCRRTAAAWTDIMRQKYRDATDANQRTQFWLRAFETAQICTCAFALDGHHLEAVLRDSDAAAMFITCSIIVQQTTRGAFDSSNYTHRLCHQRWKRLSLGAFPLLLNEITERGNSCLDDAIARVWQNYSSGGGGWTLSPDPEGPWLTTTTSFSDTSGGHQTVHYNLLTAELLVDGLPLSRLPAEYEENPRYVVLFGRATLEVVPTAMRGMQFAAMRTHHGYALHFGHTVSSSGHSGGRPSKDLLISCTRDGETMSLIPSGLLQGRLPQQFVDAYVHWYIPGRDMVDFRAIQDPWTPMRNPWVLVRAGGGWTLQKLEADILLASMLSPTYSELGRLFRYVELPAYLHITWCSAERLVQIELPRLQLVFTMTTDSPRRVLSREYRGMYLDENTQIGTFSGLKSKIVLVNDQGERSVLVPDGRVTWKRAEHDHVEVRIDEGTSRRVLPFAIDNYLGRFVDNGDLYSMLTRCYIHALTAYCLPDALTRKTGTEQALEIIRSAAVRSFSQLKAREVVLLKEIAALVPRREFYPSHLRTMQRITWDERLSPIAQHADLYREAKAILQQAASLEFFHQVKHKGMTNLDCGNEFLLERDRIRSSTFRRSGYGAEHFTTAYDRKYTLRQSRNAAKEDAARSQAAFLAAAGVLRGSDSVQYQVHDGLADHIWWRLLDNDVTMSDALAQLDRSVVTFDASHLQNWNGTLTTHWLQIHRALQQQYVGEFDKPSYMMFVATLAFASDADLQIVQLLVALSSMPELCRVPVPVLGPLGLHMGYTLQTKTLRDKLRNFLVPFKEPPDNNLQLQWGEDEGEARSRLRDEYNTNSESVLDDYVQGLASQWPCADPWQPVGREFVKFIRGAEAMSGARQLFESWWNNLQFYKYLQQLAGILQLLAHRPLDGSALEWIRPATPDQRSTLPYITETDLLSAPAPTLQNPVPVFQWPCGEAVGDEPQPGPRASTRNLHIMVDRLEVQASRQYEKDYVHAIRKSLGSLNAAQPRFSTVDPSLALQIRLEQYHKQCSLHIRSLWNAIESAAYKALDVLSPPAFPGSNELFRHSAPRLSPIFILQQLSRKWWSKLAPEWKKAIIDYGVAITALQRADRLLGVFNNPLDLAKELDNLGHSNWRPMEYPESLLIEIESSILIRDVQEEIALQMRDPPDGENSVVQLHMGEGKSFVIVPTVAAALADGNRLVRVIVAKPQSRQMHQILVAKLGGLCGHQIYQMPFSRSLRLSAGEAQIIGETYRRCAKEGGVLLVQPEHILSFKLIGVESSLSGRIDIAHPLLETQRFFDDCSRDIVDESDENFSVKFELIYTMGTQRPLELAPDRWTLIQHLLGIVAKLIPEVHARLPLGVEVEQGAPAGSFARVRLLKDEAAEYLKYRAAVEICALGMPGLPVSRQMVPLRQLMNRYLTQLQLSEPDIAAVESNVDFWTDTTRGPALLLRGLLAAGVLAFALGHKRWRVNYGLDGCREPPTRLAVPFRAKDSPTPRSEFSHPEVVIVLTCLSYYYGGLADDDLFLALEHLVRSDQAESEYALWVRDCPSLPAAFRSLVGVNLKDRGQCSQVLFPYLHRLKAVIDYFLSKIVFSREIREFPHKLSASGWDIGRRKPQPSTGFSGTNDSQHLLPLAVKYRDLERQAHTNALVLHHILQPENTVRLMPARPAEAQITDADHLLGLITSAGGDSAQSSVQVIIDVGSQILELRNIEVANRWLELTEGAGRDTQKQAVVFFNDNDELSVVDRKGNVEPLQTSPFARQLDSCLVFLDEGHTRGTDLRLPEHYRAAVTLGANLTKDRLVQACMRMRKLGYGQSLVFYINEEIQGRILATVSISSASIGLADVMIWSMHETHRDLRASMPLWAAQGARFELQALIWQEASQGDTYELPEDQARRFLEVEAVSLDKRYNPRHHAAGDVGERLSHLDLNETDNPCLTQIVDRCSRFDCLTSGSIRASLHEEQERELSPEIEQEREVQRPPPAEPLKHEIHPDVRTFIRTGTVPSGSAAFVPAFRVLKDTTVAALFDVDRFPSDLLVTRDFARTVKLPRPHGDGTALDAFQRPVQWVLTSTKSGTTAAHIVVLSPFEAQNLMPVLRSGPPASKVELHLYAPRSSLAFWSLDGLDLYTVPAARHKAVLPHPLRLQLNLFAGQLYMDCFGDYKMACDYLCLAWQKPSSPSSIPLIIRADGFIAPLGEEEQIATEVHRGGQDEEKVIPQRLFFHSPTQFLRVYLTKIRHDCEPIDRTHWGRLLVGEQLGDSDFEVEI